MNETLFAFQSARIVEWSTLENEADFSALPNKNEKRYQCKWLQTSQRKVPRRNHAEKRHQQQSTIVTKRSEDQKARLDLNENSDASLPSLIKYMTSAGYRLMPIKPIRFYPV